MALAIAGWSSVTLRKSDETVVSVFFHKGLNVTAADEREKQTVNFSSIVVVGYIENSNVNSGGRSKY